LEIRKVSKSRAVLRSFSAEASSRSLLINFCDHLRAYIKEGIATRACSANGCFSRDNISLAGLAFGKGICAFISGNSSVTFHFIKGDVGLRVTDGIKKDFEDVSLDMVAVLFWVQQLFPNLMD